MDNQDKIKQLNSLLATIDAPKEGDEVGFMLEGDLQVYRGTIGMKSSGEGIAQYQIIPKTRPSPAGKISAIIYKGKTFMAEPKPKDEWKKV